MNQNGKISRELDTVYIYNGKKFLTKKEAENYRDKPIKGSGYSIFDKWIAGIVNQNWYGKVIMIMMNVVMMAKALLVF